MDRAAEQIDIEALRLHLRVITEQDLVEMAEWLAEGAQELVRVLGPQLAASVFNLWPGAIKAIPVLHSSFEKGQRQRELLKQQLGPHEQVALCAAFGGEVLRVPVLRRLRLEKRRRWLRATFAQLRGAMPDRSTPFLVEQLRAALTSAGYEMTAFEIRKSIDPDPVADHLQLELELNRS